MGIEDLRVEIEARADSPDVIKACLLSLPHVRYLHGYNAMSWFLYEDDKHVIEILYYVRHYVCLRFALCSLEGIAEIGVGLIQNVMKVMQRPRIVIAERYGDELPKEFGRYDMDNLLSVVQRVWEKKRHTWEMDYGGDERMKTSCAEALMRLTVRAQHRHPEQDEQDDIEQEPQD
ncbi:MAG: hypothetical protein H6728_06275 [Myxococcales bacterium]|nr:hypothetical protein [Myxococcales bacterium]MCB9642665.1 hypothetical protein [Myxococcales bacterium]